MSLYNMLMGFNPACVILMPMLGRKAEEYPRFRDCFLKDDKIAIYTRVGGGNRGCGFGEEELYKDPNYVDTYDDDFDNTYATYLFNVPNKWKADFDYIRNGNLDNVSDEYVEYVKEFYPKLAKEGLIDKIFRRSELKPCPFCGCGTGNLYIVTMEQHGYDTVGIFCNGCKQTVILEENEWEGDNEQSRIRAIEAWNRRAERREEHD